MVCRVPVRSIRPVPVSLRNSLFDGLVQAVFSAVEIRTARVVMSFLRSCISFSAVLVELLMSSRGFSLLIRVVIYQNVHLDE